MSVLRRVVPQTARPAVERGTEYLYTGSRLEPETGLADYGFRDYAPRRARFTTVDPIRDGTNWYAYVGGDPVNRVDLWGLSGGDLQATDTIYNVGVTGFHYNQFVYAPVEGVGVTGSYTVSGYLDIEANDDETFTATVSATGASAGASNAGELTFFGNVEIVSGGQVFHAVELIEPTEPYIISSTSTMIGTGSFLLPPEDLGIDFEVNLNAGYILTMPEGAYAAPVMSRELPIFEE